MNQEETATASMMMKTMDPLLVRLQTMPGEFSAWTPYGTRISCGTLALVGLDAFPSTVNGLYYMLHALNLAAVVNTAKAPMIT